MFMIIKPAYGRDYKSKKALLDDWQQGRDFIIANVGRDVGRYINIHDAKRSAPMTINARYNKLRNVCVFEVNP
tara:strand:+ start:422 stop:640 length:219 start_codon:yes stop_codon:yes gene_type:complete